MEKEAGGKICRNCLDNAATIDANASTWTRIRVITNCDATAPNDDGTASHDGTACNDGCATYDDALTAANDDALTSASNSGPMN